MSRASSSVDPPSRQDAASLLAHADANIVYGGSTGSGNAKPDAPADPGSRARAAVIAPRGTAGPLRGGTVPLAIASIVACSLLTYRDTLGYWFTGTDTLTLIQTSRVGSLRDVVRLLSDPMMSGTSLVSQARFYRPVSSLSYGADYALWGLNPLGYHITDLALHAVVSVLVFPVVRALVHDGGLAPAWLGAALFTVHPALFETVPAISRRHDVLAAVFMLLSLWAFLEWRRAGRASLLALSVLCSGLALGAKEVAIIIPLLVFAHLLIFSPPARRPAARVWHAGKGSLAFWIVAAIVLAWRTIVLRGVGGYVSAPGPPADAVRLARSAARIGRSYVLDLVNPIGFADVSFAVGASMVLLFGIAVAAGAALPRRSRDRTSATARLLVFLLIWLALPLGVYLVTRSFAHRLMYIPVIPFSAACAVLLVRGLAAVRDRAGPAALAFPAMVALGLVLLAQSPLLIRYGAWQEQGRFASMLLHRLSPVARAVSPGTVIHIRDLPPGIFFVSPERWLGGVADYTLKSWLDLTEPAARIEIVVESTSALRRTAPRDLHLDVRSADGFVVVAVSLLE